MIRKSCLMALSAALPLVLAGCDKAAPTVDPAKETAAILAQIDLYNAAVKSGDIEKAVTVDARDVHLYGGGPDVISADQDLKATIAASHDPNFALAVKAEHTEVAKAGDMAWQYGTWDASSSDPKTGKPVKAKGHWVAAWRKDDQGRWKLAAVSNANAAP
jgi:ketosteroid isomerase-like protein